jgi:imidazolonepropionase-like amidohydrolase
MRALLPLVLTLLLSSGAYTATRGTAAEVTAVPVGAVAVAARATAAPAGAVPGGARKTAAEVTAIPVGAVPMGARGTAAEVTAIPVGAAPAAGRLTEVQARAAHLTEAPVTTARISGAPVTAAPRTATSVTATQVTAAPLTAPLLSAVRVTAAQVPAAHVAAAQGTAAPITAIRFGRLWDGTQLITRAVVIVERDRIIRVTSGGDIPRGAALIDLARYTGLPGLIDAHTHITYYWDRTPGTRPRGQRRLPAVTVYLAQDNARRTLETGVTTVRDLNASNDMDFAMRELTRSGAMPGPRILASGPGLSARQGASPDPDGMRKLTADRIKAGADWIKVFGSRGGFENVDGTQTVSYDEMRAIVETAHQLGKPVAIHSYGASGVRDAVRAGADSIEHGADLDADTITEMARRGVVWVPTVDHNRYYVDAERDYGFAPGSVAALQDYIARNVDSLKRAVKAGVRIAMGSDAVYSMFGQNTRELKWFVDAGMTPQQALATATVIPAAMLKLDHELGRVAPGFLADLVAVDGDPLSNIDAVIGGVRWVMKDGRVVIDKTRSLDRPRS